MRMSSSRSLRTLLTAAAAAITLVSLTGCSVVNQHLGDAWAVKYQVVVDQPHDVELTDLHVGGSQKRGGSPKVTDMGTQTAIASVDGATAAWESELIVVAGDEALVSATPPSGSIATCHVIVDETREIATAISAAPGEPVTCRVTTPRFDG